eukprot:NODE_6288_length_553_cov_2.739437_g6123_i0.p1 GENE.NODE_6288_length_553_cov_2.739437_g6123_i0~~NODE_6288_length_553_cov_2.739437_g6123_i0.p1  ORF type:complete len:147 (-),score=43.05 NODE_6288_length_553_cov_2.739437_g6123_i0:65-505(-)
MANRKKEELDEYEKAALAIWETEFLVVIAGPNFYEDRTHTVFSDERCDQTLVQQHPNRFFGFWGPFYNRYNDRQPHDGYQILRKWRDSFFDPYGVDMRKRQAPPRKEEAPIVQRLYIVTTTVDGSFSRAGFREEEVYSMWGDVNHW